MEELTRLEELTVTYGPSGYEDIDWGIRDYLETQLRPVCDAVWADTMGNLIGVKRCGRPDAKKLLLDAHMDEVGLIVTGIENGFLRFTALGGIDARVLPATAVGVRMHDPYGTARYSWMSGVIDTMPPHALKAEDMEKAVPIEDLVIDVGLTQSEAEAYVPLGTAAVFCTWPSRLRNDRLAGKTLDDRACVEVILRVLRELQGQNLGVDIYCMFSTQEELGTRGASVGVYGIDPDVALVLDVTHGKTPDTQGIELMELGGGPAIGVGPNMTRKVTETLIRLAEDENIPYQLEVMSGNSGTNAWPIQISRGGVATGVLSVPLRYMHTPNEVIDLADVAHTARLVTAFARNIGEVLT